MGRAWRSGLGTKARYGKLLRQGDGVFTRSAGGGRVVETGKYWLEVSNGLYAFDQADGQGFNAAKFRIRPVDELPLLDVVIPEEEVRPRKTK
jgi:hypothetical protein